MEPNGWGGVMGATLSHRRQFLARLLKEETRRLNAHTNTQTHLERSLQTTQSIIRIVNTWKRCHTVQINYTVLNIFKI